MKQTTLFFLVFLIFTCCNQVNNNSGDSSKPVKSIKETEVVEVIDTMKVISSNRYSGKYLFASEVLLTPDDFKFITCSELRIIRNEIFARYGYKFKSEDLIEYFSKQKWYIPLYDNVDTFLNEIEKENITLILVAEKTCVDLTVKEQLDSFIYYLDSNDKYRIVSEKFGETVFNPGSQETFVSGTLFPKTKKYRVLIYETQSTVIGADQIKFSKTVALVSTNDGDFVTTIGVDTDAQLYQINDSTVRCVENSGADSTVYNIVMNKFENIIKK